LIIAVSIGKLLQYKIGPINRAGNFHELNLVKMGWSFLTVLAVVGDQMAAPTSGERNGIATPTSAKLSVSEIAYELGFEHSQSFNRLFKSKTDLSP
jgi:AraC-like DNA-binding protein